MDGKCVRNPIQSNPNPESESEYKNSAELKASLQIAAGCGELRPESNPIQSNPNPESESESKDSAELQSAAALTLRPKDGIEYPAVDVMRELRTMKA